MKNIIYLLLAGISLSLFSCNEKPFLYDYEQNKLNFLFERMRDSSIRKTFVYDDDQRVRDTVYVEVKTQGYVVDYDRAVHFKQVNVTEKDKINAVVGKHYLPFDDKEMQGKYIIKAGTAFAKLPVILLRDPSLKENEVVLRLEIASNADFVPGAVQDIRKNVYIADKLTRPSNWSSVFFGAYGFVKHQFMIKATGLKWDNDTFSTMRDMEYIQFLVAKLRGALKLENEKRGEGNELREAPEKGQDVGPIVKF